MRIPGPPRSNDTCIPSKVRKRIGMEELGIIVFLGPCHDSRADWTASPILRPLMRLMVPGKSRKSVDVSKMEALLSALLANQLISIFKMAGGQAPL
jgi:hypothetical protein